MIAIGSSEYAAASGRLPEARVVVDDVADELRVGHEVRRDVVAERQREREDRARDEGREDERQDDPPEGRPRPAAEVRRGLEERGRDPLQARVDRQDHVRQPEVAQHEPGVGESRRGPGPSMPNGCEAPVEEAVALEDRPPRVDLDEVGRPERHQDRDDEQRRASAATRCGPCSRRSGRRAATSVTVTRMAIPTVRIGDRPVDLVVEQAPNASSVQANGSTCR